MQWPVISLRKLQYLYSLCVQQQWPGMYTYTIVLCILHCILELEIYVELWPWWSNPEDFQKDMWQPVLFTCMVAVNLYIQSTREFQLPVEDARCCESISIWYGKRCPALIEGKQEAHHPWMCEFCAINDLSTTVSRMSDVSCTWSWCEGAEQTRNSGIVSSIKNCNCIADGIITDSHNWVRIGSWWAKEVQLDAEHEINGWTRWHLSWWPYNKSEKTAIQLAWSEMYFSIGDTGHVW